VRLFQFKCLKRRVVSDYAKQFLSPHFTYRNLLYQINFQHPFPRAHAHCRFRALPQAQPSTPILPWLNVLLRLAPAHKPPDAPAVLSTQYAVPICVSAVAIDTVQLNIVCWLISGTTTGYPWQSSTDPASGSAPQTGQFAVR